MRKDVIDDPRARDALIAFHEQQAQSHGLNDGLVTDVLNRLPTVESVSLAEGTVIVLLQRATGWIHSLRKLDQVFDYQAHSSACRALLELAVDVALITHEPLLAERMEAFEESQILKAAFKYREFVKKTKETSPDEPERLRFIPLNEARIKALRTRHWGIDTHPRTWFGPDFLQVAAEADRRVGSEYERFYVDHYDRLCWGTHGSTLMMVRKSRPETLPGIAFMAVAGATTLALELTQRALRFFHEDADAIGDKLAARMMYARNQLRLDALDSITEQAAG